MTRLSPTLEGFRIAFRCPSLCFAEITWRWSIGMSAIWLLVVGVIDYLDTLPVTTLDTDLLGTHQAPLIWRAVIHIFRGSLNRARLAALFGLFALSVLWIIAVSIGRLAIVRSMIEYCSDTISGASYNASGRDISNRNLCNPAASNRSAGFWSLIGLNFLRAVVTLAALLALVSSAKIGSAIMGSAIIANFAPSLADSQPAFGLLIFLALAAIIAISWMGLNWLLSFASIFAVRNAEDTAAAISTAVGVLNERSGPVLAVSIWNLFGHFAACVVAAGVASMLLVLISILPTTLVVVGIVLVALAYFAVVDWLYVARLAAYVCIAEVPEAFTPSIISPILPAAGGERATDTSPQTAMDRDEPILSDLPGMAFQLSS
jgi:hypothetical protein